MTRRKTPPGGVFAQRGSAGGLSGFLCQEFPGSLAVKRNLKPEFFREAGLFLFPNPLQGVDLDGVTVDVLG